MDDARNLQYGIGFDTADAETSVENLGEKVETLEENIGAVEVGAQQMGASAVSACQMGQGAAERFTGAVSDASGGLDDMASSASEAGNAAQKAAGHWNMTAEGLEWVEEAAQAAEAAAESFRDEMDDSGGATGRFRAQIKKTAESAQDMGTAFNGAMADEYRLKQGLCAMFHHVPGDFPACPCVHRLGHPGGLLGFLNALGVDRLGLCTVPCPVQALGKGGYALAIQLPCLAHDGGQIKLFHLKSCQKYIKNGLTVSADNYEDLAKAMGLEGDAIQNFVDTMDTWNAAVAAGEDKEFGRNNGMDADLSTAPYYAIKIAPGIHHTMGGLKINTDAEVLDTQGNAIPGLYAAGETTGGVHGGNRIGGNAVCDFVVFGRIAGNNASAYAAN